MVRPGRTDARAAASLASVCALGLLAAAPIARAQEVPASTGELTRAPRIVAKGGETVETAPAARTKARARRRIVAHASGSALSNPGASRTGREATSAVPGGPGAPPPALPVAPGSRPDPQ